MSDVLNVLRSVRGDLMTKANVVGVGKGLKRVRNARTEQVAITVLVRDKISLSQLSPRDVIPKFVDGIPTDVFEVGDLRLLGIRTDRRRPAQPGMSIGHYRVTAGTLGALVKDSRTGEVLILSNNHILANSTSGRDGRAEIGDAILQPGSYDGGKMDTDVIARLERFIPLFPDSKEADCRVAQRIQTALNNLVSVIRPSYEVRLIKLLGQENLVDCALAKPISDDMVRSDVLEIGKISGVAEASEKTVVKKSGRTTGLTRGEVVSLNTTVKVSLSDDETAAFADQIVTTSISQGGDSGSLVMDNNNAAIGLLFAGSSKATILNRIRNVLSLLQVELIT